jgi:hypothetical protein
MVTVKIAVIFLIAIGVMSIIFWFLVTENKIKPNKLTKLFYYDDESFIKSWAITKEKGMLMHNIKNVIWFTATNGVIVSTIILKDNNSRMYGREHILLLVITTIITGLITSLIKWGIEHDRYSKLKEKSAQ